MGTPALDYENYTLADLDTWDDGNKYELVHGRAVLMGGAGWTHGQVVGALHGIIQTELQSSGRLCGVDGSSSTEVIIPNPGEQPEQSSVAYIPDLLILCDKSKLDAERIYGGPEFVAEVLSNSTGDRDVGVKRRDYQRAGVQEYWILDPKSRSVVKFHFQRNEHTIHESGDNIRLETLGVEFKVDALFPFD